MANTTFDYIVVGAGTAGCLLANRLSANPAKRVLLIEAGQKDDYHWIHIPVGYLYCIGNPRTDWMYRTEPCDGLNGRTLQYPRGKTLGGCSSINGMIYMRGQARDFDGWAQFLGDEAWSWRNCLPYFKLHEDYHRGADGLHGAKGSYASSPDDDGSIYREFKRQQHAGGEWRVENQRLRWAVLDAFAQASVEAGIPARNDFNTGDNEGVGYFEVNQRSGWRWNTAKAFLRPVCMDRANFELWTSTQATRLLINSETAIDAPLGLRCRGVQVWNGHAMIEAHARAEVILCCGSVGSPQLLQLSGIGPGDLLKRHGIEVLLDSPGVGANLQDHLQIRSVYKVSNTPTLNTQASSLWGKAKMGVQYLLHRSGPMSMSPSQLGAFTRSDEARPYANLEFHVQPLSLDAFGQPLHRFDAITASVCNLNPSSRGHVQIRSSNFEVAPVVAPNYLSTAEDRKVAADSIRLTRRIMAQPAMKGFSPEEYKPGLRYQSDEELAKLAGDIASTIFHPVGTTRMGQEGDPMAVLDSRLCLRGVAGLRVVDAGAMPNITSGNTNSPTLMMAEKAAQWIIDAAQR